MGKTKNRTKTLLKPGSSTITGLPFTPSLSRPPKGQDTDVEKRYLRILELDPENTPALKALAQTLHSLGRPKDALPYLVRAVMLQPQDAPLLCDLADLWQAAGHFPQAMAAYQKALEFAPDFPRALYSLGCAQMAAKE